MLVCLSVVPMLAGVLAAQPALRIVVIAGEDAINVVQQKTAVAPVVEVRDRNNQPVAGAIVRFAVRNGRATFSGARTLTVTTNAAGRAAAAGLTPTGTGAVQIGASAAFQGQTAVATIVQTNVLTAAEAAAAASGVGASGGTGATAGGAAGGGTGAGGLSATTLGIVGGAVAGGAVLAKETLFAGGIPGLFTGQFRMSTAMIRQVTTAGGSRGTCSVALDITGTLRVDDSHFSIDHLETPISTDCVGGNLGTPRSLTGTNGDLNGPPEDLRFNRTNSGGFGNDGSGSGADTIAFSGVLSNDAITGTITLGHTFTAANLPPPQTYTESYPPIGTSVTLLKQP